MQQGFTLVELAIVLMIIGLLIGGVLRGQELMQNARITSTIQQVKAYQGAMVSFHDTYGDLPGDLRKATDRLPGCNTDNSCKDGNGNSVFDTATNFVWSSVSVNIDSEAAQFWKHLALAHLISGIDVSASAPEWGKSNPIAKIKGGFFMNSSAASIAGSTQPIATGNYLILRNSITGQWVCGSGSGDMEEMCVISPQRGLQIDRKMDDGFAITGDVLAVSSGWNKGCGGGTNGFTGYTETKTTSSCDMMFRLN